MRRLLATAWVLLALLVGAAPAQASFGLHGFDVAFSTEKGSPVVQAGSHPFAWTTQFGVDTEEGAGGTEVPTGSIKHMEVELPPGVVVNPTAAPRCSTADFIQLSSGAEGKQPACPNTTAVGVVAVRIRLLEEVSYFDAAVFNLQPPPGVPAEFGFNVLGVPVTMEGGVNARNPFNLKANLADISQALPFYGAVLTLWGNPADPAHDPYRGSCVRNNFRTDTPAILSKGECSDTGSQTPLVTMPTSCTGPLATSYRANSWQEPDQLVSGTVLTHDNLVPPNPLGLSGCEELGFHPSISAKPTSLAAESPSGMDFSLDVEDEGLTNPAGEAQSQIRKAVVQLPEGFTTNPALAEGLEVCTEADLARESAFSEAGAGCPDASKVGSVEIQTPLLEEALQGSLFIAKPYENPFGSLLALYIVARNRDRGVFLEQPLKVETDPVTGRITTIGEDLPQLPFSSFRLHFREGTRSPLATPPGCGEYQAQATLYPWSGGAPIATTSAFEIVSGPDAGPCPSGGLPPFHPNLLAGTLNNAAGRFSPFDVGLSRTDSEQEITHFSIKLPPGIVAKLAGVPYCSDMAIAAAAARTGPHGGQEEIESPSCPAASEIGRTLVGSGVGPSPAYAPGRLYLAGPYHGAPLSMAAITAAKVGPFDLGTVVVREALRIDPETAEVFIDATGSDPLPHIIRGIPVHLRDIRAYVDRPQFVLNPTDCTRTSTASTVLGSGFYFGSEADDRPVTVTTPFQAADCAALPFKPRLFLKLKGGTKRSAVPALTATLRMRGLGEAGVAGAQVTMPKSEFLEQRHIKTICTRVQFKAGSSLGDRCPAASIYGRASAVSPILSEPLTGPVYLRSSEHNLPDIVVALHNSQVDIVLHGRIDSVHGRLRTTFEATPDAPISRFTLRMFGGKKGLLVNSTDLCRRTHRALVAFTGQNGKVSRYRQALGVKCGPHGRRKR
jgi:hypothetical protein